MKNEVLVIGHRNPDADSICAAVGYADFKRRTGMENAVAARCGETNARIDFILDYFNVPAPRLVSDVTPKVADIMRRDVEFAREEDTALDALSLMDEKKIRVLPILGRDDSLKGLVSVFKLSDYYMPSVRRMSDTRRVETTLRNIVKALNAQASHLVRPETEESLIMMIAAMDLSSFNERFKKFDPSKVILIVGDRLDIQRSAIDAGVRLMIVTGGLQVWDAIVHAAKEKGVSILVSPHDSATTALLTRCSSSVMRIVDSEFTSFSADVDLSDARHKASTLTQNIFPVLDSNRKLSGLFSKSDFLVPVEKKLILVDHNELSQAVRGADHATILEIIDHHKIGALATNSPILFYNEPVGSTSTIVADFHNRDGLDISRPMAGLLMSGIVTDTLNLKSPTATAKDRVILERLEKIVGMSASELAEKIFASGSILSIKSPNEAITADCKEYAEKEHRFSVAQVEELGFSRFHEKKTALLEQLSRYADKNGYLFSCLLVTDINTNTSFLLVAGHEAFRNTLDYEEVEPGIYDMPGIVSRKKQLMPFLIRCIGQMEPLRNPAPV
ncbi:MAG: putative manganese-dependent inorganic diphosphatase [Verrucomicrobiae bacterium]|nr:putative manganese-dependent inorganic diphosphatase [Verrucomicrobiae bacterium]